MKVLLTGGTGFIGSQIARLLLLKRHSIQILDDLSNSSKTVLDELQNYTNNFISFEKLNVSKYDQVMGMMLAFRPDVVIHLAGLKSVSDSVDRPLDYYNTNVFGTLNLLRCMDAVGCKKIIFSSSATVYGESSYLPLDELHPTDPKNPYGRSKLFAERVIEDWSRTSNDRSAIILRYFNPIGASPDLKLGENPRQKPTNILPVLISCAQQGSMFKIFGDTYTTTDGTAERDYIHVVDLAEAHVLAASTELEESSKILNLGTGQPTSVRAMSNLFEEVSGISLNVSVESKRAGDIQSSWTSNMSASNAINWAPTRSVRDAVRDAWMFATKETS